MASAEDPARRFRRSRWPDVVIVVGVLALGATGAIALWGDRLFHSDSPPEVPAAQATTPTGGT
jgi:protein-S-isoprenylcysteine O-methyltransferase Ste14